MQKTLEMQRKKRESLLALKLQDLKKDKDEDEDIFQGAVKSTIGKHLDSKVIDRHYSDISDSERTSAKMTKASYINLTEGSLASSMFAKEHIKGWTLDLELSNEHGSVFQHAKTGELRIAYRGTQRGVDWKTNARMATGLTENSTQINEMEDSKCIF